MNEIEALITIAADTFACKDATSAEPNPYFAKPPYKPFAMNAAYPDGSHGIYNAQGINCLRFRDKPGAVFTTKENAIALAEKWNAEKNSTHQGAEHTSVSITPDEYAKWLKNIEERISETNRVIRTSGGNHFWDVKTFKEMVTVLNGPPVPAWPVRKKNT